MSKISIKNVFKSKKNLIVSIGVIFLVGCLIIANYLSLLLVRTDSGAENVSSSPCELYMLTLAKSKVEKEAKMLASDYQNIGAGGYIWEQNDYYYVVSSVYNNKNDAVLVQNSVKANQGFDSEIITVKFPSFSINGNFSADEKRVLDKALNCFYSYYLSIYDIAISLDTNVNNEVSAKLAVNNAHNTLNNVVDDFNTLFSSIKSDDLNELSAALSNSLKESQDLCLGTLVSPNQTYSSLLKYRYTAVLNEWKKLNNSN